MTGKRWALICEHLEAALPMKPEDRAAYLARVCAGDEALRNELESLLQASDSSGTFLEQPPTCTSAPMSDTEPLPAGSMLGHWRVLRLIGRGGMGEVYDAERASDDFQQHVALKVMRRESAAQLERFDAERQILARFDHPGIARLLDGGSAPDGRPYFVMEYIDGQPITEFCDAAGANLDERLALFLQVCDAVAYAHRHLVVHRDIKPGNVLVDREGRARLLDFGIAKPLDIGIDAGGARATMTTTLLTPDYAAPEQLAGEPVTTATDVYALGVLLFELLTGRKPWAISGQPLAHALRVRLEHTAPRVSDAAAEANERPIPPRALRGDLDAIVAKCLRREPQHRYATVEALKRDIERSLRGDPIAARGDATLYVLGRFVHRYRWAVAGVASIMAILVLGVAATAWQAQRAEREAARAAATRDFLIGIFKASDPRVAQDRPRGQITARELLDASVARLDQQFADDPQTHIQLLGVAKAIYGELGEIERYDALHSRHLAMAREHYGEKHPVVLSVLLDEVDRAYAELDSARALQLLDGLDPLIHNAGQDQTLLRARWWMARGQALFQDSRRQDEALGALRHAADLFAQTAPDHPGHVTALAEIGTFFANNMDYTRARSYYEQALAVSDRVKDRNDSELATIYGNLGHVAYNLGEFEAADAAYGRSTEIIRRTHGESHPDHWYRAASWARAVHLGGDRERAAMLFADLLRHIPPDNESQQALEAFELYAGCLAAEGRPLEALPLLEKTEQRYRTLVRFDFMLPRVRLTLGDAYDRAGRPDEARAMLLAALEERVATLPPDHQGVLAVRERWGRFLLSQGDVAGAATQFREVVRRAGDRKLAHIALAYGGLARVALIGGDLGSARSASDTAVRLWENVTGFRDVRMGPYLWLVHSEVLRQAGDRDAARVWARQALQARKRFDHPSSASIPEAEAVLQAASSEGL